MTESSDIQGKKVLVADASDYANRLRDVLQENGYNVRMAKDGYETVDMVRQFRPDLVFLDMDMPRFQSLDVMRLVKSDLDAEVGIIVSAMHPLQQHFDDAVSRGACYFVPKPYELVEAKQLIDRYFSKGLKPDSCTLKLQGKPDIYYDPQVEAPTTYAKFWGTRGSVPVAGLDYYRYGGNTSCLQLAVGNHCVIIDAGTGIRKLGDEIMRSNITDIHLLLGHTHWDHVIGFPFFAPVYDPRFNIHIYAPRGYDKDTREVFNSLLEEEFFPIRMQDMKARFTFHEIEEDQPIQFGQLLLYCHHARHPGATVAFKIITPRKTMIYATDNEFLAGYLGHPRDINNTHQLLESYTDFVKFCSDCDIMVHEAQYLPSEYRERVNWGHSSVANAAVLARLANVHEWIVTHHDPNHSDEILLSKIGVHRQALEDAGATNCRVHMAYDNMVLPI